MIQINTVYPKAWESLLEDCRSAKTYIYFEQFIWEDFDTNEIGTLFLDVFKQKVKEGVNVKLIIDSIGSIGLYTNPWRQKEIEDAGIDLEFFGMVPRWKSVFPFNIIHRDHRKVVIVDDRVAHVGGVIISERSRDWHDIDARTVDPKYIKEIKGAFLQMWDEIRDKKEHEQEYDTDAGLILKNNPENNDLYAEILQKIKNATTKIVIITPYFSPNFKILWALKKACKRGVHVDIILPENCDSGLTSMVNASYVHQLQRSKINMHFYFTSMNHGKLVVIDDWATLGSMNFDRLSFFYNRELNMVFTEDIQPIEKVIADTKANSNLIERSYFKKLSMFERLKAGLGWFLRPIA